MGRNAQAQSRTGCACTDEKTTTYRGSAEEPAIDKDVQEKRRIWKSCPKPVFIIEKRVLLWNDRVSLEKPFRNGWCFEPRGEQEAL